LPAFRNAEGGAVVSASIRQYAYASLERMTDVCCRIASQDIDAFVEARSIRELEYDGNLDLLKAAVLALNLPGGMDIVVRCDAPPGSGLGSSASIGVALLGLLDRLRATEAGGRVRMLTRFELADLACRLEADLGIIGGMQDQFSAAVGGINYMEFLPGNRVLVEPLHLAHRTIYELEKHLVLCYSGKSRLSGDANHRMISAYENGEPRVVNGLRNVKRIARDVYSALVSDDLGWFADLLNEEWAARQELADGIVTPEMHAQREAAMAAGAVAAKVCGAGGGGCILFYCAPNREGEVRRALETCGGRILEVTFEMTGLQVWEV
jgi:D-glycero-alpha-D-manno-heptose-7-phosphate kinase